jgi:hypothetical protein
MKKEEDRPKAARDIAAEVTKALTGSSDSMASLRTLCREYNEDELHKAIAYVHSPPQWDGHRKVVRDEIDRLRQREFVIGLEEVKKEIGKPTWLDTWTFRFVVVGAIIAFLDFYRPLLSRDSNSSPTLPMPASTHPSEIQSALPLAPTKSQQKPLSADTNSVAVPVSPKK